MNIKYTRRNNFGVKSEMCDLLPRRVTLEFLFRFGVKARFHGGDESTKLRAVLTLSVGMNVSILTRLFRYYLVCIDLI